jgi:RNA recognition motif-containing protein
MTKDTENGWSRGFGFVSFSSSEEADEAIKNLNGSWIAGKQMKVEKTRSDLEQLQ